MATTTGCHDAQRLIPHRDAQGPSVFFGFRASYGLPKNDHP
jgi:hypothetical protein